MKEPVWLNLKAVLVAHDKQLAQHGGLEGVRDFGLLESALARPRMAFCYEGETLDVFDCAALYMVGIARNHPFNDANKRTSLLVGYAFLRLNGHDVLSLKAEEVELMVKLAEGTTEPPALAAWLRGQARKTQKKP